MGITFFSIIINSSFFLKFIIFLLAIILVWQWGLFLEKFGVFKLKSSLSESFRREFNSGEMLDKIYNRLTEKKKIFSPLARIFFAGMKELNMSNIKNIDFSARYSDSIKSNIRDRIYSSMAIERSKIVQEMRGEIPSFTTMAAIAPLVGMLGTVWEIMYTFYSINSYKVVNLSLVIPGIAQSLVSTIFGITIAIFSIIFYNFLTKRLNNFIEDSEIFSHDLTNILSRELDILTNSSSKRAMQERRAKMERTLETNDDDDDI